MVQTTRSSTQVHLPGEAFHLLAISARHVCHPGRGSTETPFHRQTSFADRSQFAGVPPSLRPSMTSFFVFIPLVPPWINGSPGVSQGALPLTVVKPQSTPPLQMLACTPVRAPRIDSLEDLSPATAMTNQIKGDQTGVKVVGSCARQSQSAVGRGLGSSFDLSMKTECRSPD